MVSTGSYPVGFHDVFSRLLLQNEENVMALQGMHSIIHIYPHSHDHGQRTLAATLAVYSSQESPALELEVNLSILLVG